MMPKPNTGGPPMMPAMGPPLPGTMPVVFASEMRPLVGGYKAAKTSNDEISHWSRTAAKTSNDG